MNEKYKNIRTQSQAAEDLQLIMELRKKRWSWRRIGWHINSLRDYDLTWNNYYHQYQTAVSNTQKEALQNKDELIEAELSELDYVLSEAQEAWERSKDELKKTITTVKQKNKGTNEVDVKKFEIELLGDPKYLDIIVKVGERRAKLLALDKELKQPINLSVNVIKPEVPDDGYEIDDES